MTGTFTNLDHRDLAVIHSELTISLALAQQAVDTAISEEDAPARTPRFALHQNLPNPFNSSTAIRFDLDREQSIDLAIYNLAGQRVATLAAEMRPPGNHVVYWSGRSETGRPLASGLYLYRLSAGDERVTRKLMLVR